MALIQPKTLSEWHKKQLNDWQSLQPNINLESDGMVYMDAAVISERLFELQQDAITLVNNAFIAYATGDELSNLGLDRGIPRNQAMKANGEVTFSRVVVANADYTIAEGTLISTQPDGVGRTINFKTINESTLYGVLATPGIITEIPQVSGGGISDGQYFYKITAMSGDNKETDAGIDSSIVIANGLITNSIDLSWSAVPRAVAYNIYISVNSSSNFKFLAETTSSFYTDSIGASSSTRIPPIINNTGSTFIIVEVEATDAGTQGNVGANAVTKFIQKPAGIDIVANANSITGGVDQESDINYRARLRDLLTSGIGRVTKTGYRNTIKNVPGVETVSVVRPFPGVNNTIWIYITAYTTTGLPGQDIIDLAQAEVDAAASGDDGRAVCDDVTVKAPNSVIMNLDIIITELAAGFNQSVAEDELESLLIIFFRGVGVGGSIRIVDIENVIHDSNSVNDFTLINPTINVDLNHNEMVVLGTINYTYNLPL